MLKTDNEFTDSSTKALPASRQETYSQTGKYETDLGKTLTLIRFEQDGTLVGRLFGKEYEVPRGHYWPATAKLLGND